MERKLIDLTGATFGEWVVIERGPNNPTAQRQTRWVCACICGEHALVQSKNLRSGRSKSCGNHGPSRSAEYAIWSKMKGRCGNPSNTSYADYGGRGIRVAKEWVDDFAAFFAHVGPRPSPAHTIDRIDVEGHYAPGNVRWATRVVQNNNRRNTQMIFYRGEVMALGLAVRLAGSVVVLQTARKRLQIGWPVERALSEPSRGYGQATARG